MDLARAVEDVLLGASMRQVSVSYRQALIEDFGFRPEEVRPDTFREEVGSFMRRLARELGERHAGDPRVGQALFDWIMECDHYEAWDALLSGFVVDGRDRLVRRGKILFPGPLTAHWTDR
ncbi:MAG: hypothetical protein H6835_21200 [Planctomycetes bacterium]|nr:hypothetical protein [Planctomycetota bacterium]MCB9880119.1 hypothetical protein [Planctomycetota bacterium]MCB9884545.1 hypothetical protein [Planctomycetota bacterium]